MHIKRIQKELTEEIERLKGIEHKLIFEKTEERKNPARKAGKKTRDISINDKNEIGIHDKKTENERLRCVKKGNHYRYYFGNKYLNKSQMGLVKEAANREYREKLLPPVRDRIRKLEHALKELTDGHDKPEKVYEDLHPARKKIVDPLIVSKQEFIKSWSEEPYEKWEIKDEDAAGVFYTQKGERVRSKSEIIIADTLARYDIPYKYEYPLKLKDGRQVTTRRPDFIALNTTTLEEMIIEHLGMLDQDRYYQKNIEKIDLYERNGYLIGKNLILMHETSYRPLDTTILDKYIMQFLL
ncbi:MAG: hypothetical protein IK111_08765 [Lachnospiraceae bacterium]|nr:hypothetical protein [Lachnospiraceae bacterium]